MRFLQVNGIASEVDFQVRRLKLDELELASLRGEVEEAGLKLDLEARQDSSLLRLEGFKPNRAKNTRIIFAAWKVHEYCLS